MSLSIDTEKVVAVYALGEWHQVQKGSVDIDAFELMHYLDGRATRERCDDNRGDMIDYYEMGALYEGKEPEYRSTWMNKGSGERMHSMKTPSGSAGFAFKTPKGNWKAFSIVECKAFEYEP